MTLALTISSLVVAAVLMLVLALLTPLTDQLRARGARALERIARGGNPEQRALEGLPTQLRRDDEDSGLARLWPRLAQLLRGISPRQILIGALLTVGLGLGLMIGTGIDLRICFGAALVIVLAGSLINRMRIRAARRTAIADAIPEAIEMMVRSLRVGLPISAAIQLTGRDMTGPLAEELRQTSDRISFGQDTSEALYELSDRTGNADLHFLAASVSIQIVTGGNLADVLDRLSGIARARQQLRRKVDSITAEAKWSGRFLSAFPLLAIGGINLANPDYFDGLSDQPWFPYLVGVVIVLLVVNVIFMRWLSQLDKD